jgi:hypothetical protein
LKKKDLKKVRNIGGERGDFFAKYSNLKKKGGYDIFERKKHAPHTVRVPCVDNFERKIEKYPSCFFLFEK